MEILCIWKYSIFTADLVSLYQALLYILKKQTSARNYCLCTDSLTAIDSLQKIYTDNSVVNEINHKLQQIVNRYKNITFIYIPSHIGIDGIPQVDAAAKWGSRKKYKDCLTFTLKKI